jgi:cob(I)alamin adenosyltransferase
MVERKPSLVDGLPTEEARTKGFVHAYYGDGKGKTTAAIGLAVRAVGAGYRVLLIQFDKGHDPERSEHYAERSVLRGIDGLRLEPTGCERIRPDGTFRFGVEPEDRAEAQRGLALARAAIDESSCDVLILDEALAAVLYKLLEEQELVELRGALASWCSPDISCPSPSLGAPTS